MIDHDYDVYLDGVDAATVTVPALVTIEARVLLEPLGNPAWKARTTKSAREPLAADKRRLRGRVFSAVEIVSVGRTTT
ncbi:MAG TPA: hypothetical protein VMO26_23280 [Vicinamibacterales bacterium]|nr:hypothetical protein [Vicinamibacterales bacterium]